MTVLKTKKRKEQIAICECGDAIYRKKSKTAWLHVIGDKRECINRFATPRK